MLEAAGFRVIVPEQDLCCGRPLYDYGMLDTAEALAARKSWTRCGRRSRAGVPIVGLEPSCVAVFRDELTNLFPHDEDAKRLQRADLHCSSEFLEQKAPGLPAAEARSARRWSTATATTRRS